MSSVRSQILGSDVRDRHRACSTGCLQYVGALFVALCMGLLSSSYSVAESNNDNKATVVGMLVATTSQCGIRLDSLLHTCISATDVPPILHKQGDSRSQVGVLCRSPSPWVAGTDSFPHRWPI